MGRGYVGTERTLAVAYSCSIIDIHGSPLEELVEHHLYKEVELVVARTELVEAGAIGGGWLNRVESGKGLGKISQRSN